jgi:hypothetical protein
MNILEKILSAIAAPSGKMHFSKEMIYKNIPAAPSSTKKSFCLSKR